MNSLHNLLDKFKQNREDELKLIEEFQKHLLDNYNKLQEKKAKEVKHPFISASVCKDGVEKQLYISK